MQQQTLAIINKLGLHARAAAKLVAIAARFGSKIEITHKEKTVNGKSIMAVMMLGANKGSEIEVIITGEDETEAMAAIEALINNRFGEDE